MILRFFARFTACRLRYHPGDLSPQHPAFIELVARCWGIHSLLLACNATCTTDYLPRNVRLACLSLLMPFSPAVSNGYLTCFAKKVEREAPLLIGTMAGKSNRQALLREGRQGKNNRMYSGKPPVQILLVIRIRLNRWNSSFRVPFRTTVPSWPARNERKGEEGKRDIPVS